MRIAILSALEKTVDDELCAALPYLGENVLARQCEIALALGAQRVICLAQGHDRAILEVQRRLEAQDLDFHVVPNSIAMVGLITADDDLVLFGDSVLIDLTSIPVKLIEGRGIASIAHDSGKVVQLERIDADRFWAGVLVARGDIASQLADLPRDSDVISLLLRLALQARTPIIALDSEQSGAVLKVTDKTVLSRREKQIFDGALPVQRWSGVGQALATQCVSALGPSILGRSHRIILSFAALCCATGLALSAMNFALSALFMLLPATFSLNIMGALNALHIRLRIRNEVASNANYFRALMDVVIALSLIVIHLAGASVAALLIAPISLMALRVAENSAAQNQRPFMEALFADRIILIAIILASVVMNHALLVAAVIIVLALAFVLFWGARESIRQT